MTYSAFDPFRPPMLGAEAWLLVMNGAGWRCECTGECGRSHTKTGGRCGTEHGRSHRLAAVPADLLASPFQATTGAVDLVAMCVTCQAGAKRVATKAADLAAAENTDQLELFDLTGGDAA
ncbi:hypothetical protein AB0H36_15790 [Kribbella sp. NPDC050820]|uniref:hypothetical protein n=1 Tax=Kribbella sp. NPDC050820 TaxID=3155408 RepID=UPI0033D9F493